MLHKRWYHLIWSGGFVRFEGTKIPPDFVDVHNTGRTLPVRSTGPLGRAVSLGRVGIAYNFGTSEVSM